jgi:hypothetical protein
MKTLAKLSEKARAPGDPKILEVGRRSSLTTADRTARNLGWFSIGLGLAELLAAGPLSRALGMERNQALIRAYGLREIAAGVTCLSVDNAAGAWSRVAGDVVDIATLASGLNDDNPKKRNVGLALVAVTGITLLDIACGQALTAERSRGKSPPRDYSDRSGWPKGLEHSRGAARDFKVPEDMRAMPRTGAAQQGEGTALH